MDLHVLFGSALCYTKEFTINGVAASDKDFGEKYDRSPDDAELYGCGDMRFTRKPSLAEILLKYAITEGEYSTVCDKLEEGLSFGSCGWCV